MAAESESEAEDESTGEPLTLRDLNTIRMPRLLLEKWVEESFFDEAVRGCFVRLGVGKDDKGAPQYKICEIVSVEPYKNPYGFGEFETRSWHGGV